MSSLIAVLFFGLNLLCFTSAISPFFLHKMVEPRIYDKLLQPGKSQNRSETTQVYIAIYIETISSVFEISMDYDVDFYLRTIWLDPRLEFESDSYIDTNDEELEKKLWLPDLYFVNAKSVSYMDITVPNLSIWVYPNGTVKSSRRIRGKMSCFMNLRMFPTDHQTCSIKIRTYYTRQIDVNVSWYEPLTIAPHVELPDFKVTNASVDTCDGYYEGWGTFNCLLANVTLTRYSGFVFIHIVMPTGTVVMISWIGFWISPTAVPARASLSITTFLALATQATGFRSLLPPVAYATAVDVWMTICRIFVFGALVEFAIAYYYHRYQERKQKEEEKKLEKERKNEAVDYSDPYKKQSKAIDILEQKFNVEQHLKWSNVDKISQFLFPSMFILANIAFWVAYPPSQF